MKLTFYVDGDNSPVDRIAGIELLKKNDEVKIFYNRANGHYTKECNREELMKKSECQISFTDVACLNNSVDFIIAMELALYYKEPISDEYVILISADNHIKTIC